MTKNLTAFLANIMPQGMISILLTAFCIEAESPTKALIAGILVSTRADILTSAQAMRIASTISEEETQEIMLLIKRFLGKNEQAVRNATPFMRKPEAAEAFLAALKS